MCNDAVFEALETLQVPQLPSKGPRLHRSNLLSLSGHRMTFSRRMWVAKYSLYFFLIYISSYAGTVQ